jgi:hypothetical protein
MNYEPLTDEEYAAWLSSVGVQDNPDTRTTHADSQVDGQISRPDPHLDNAGQLPELALEPNILAVFEHDIGAAGLAGEVIGAKILYLCITSRHLPWGMPGDRPVSLLPKGTSGSGKSYLVDSVVRFFPEGAVWNLGSMSRRYLLYSEESLSHTFIYVPEWGQIQGDEELVAALRTLLSEGRLIHGTVEGERMRKARRIEKEGPTGLLVTTTRAATDPELETRCFSFTTDDSPEQTRSVFRAIANLEGKDTRPVDYVRWHELQRWLQAKESRVLIPYVQALSELVPIEAVRLRRDFVALLSMIRAYALLHQATRSTSPDGQVIATIADYAAVRDLIGAVIAEGVEATVSGATRQTVKAVADELFASHHETTTVKAIEGRLKVGRSATYDRIRRALVGGWLVNHAAKDERGLKLALGAELPSAVEGFLPEPEEVVRLCPDGHLDNQDAVLPAEIGELSGNSGRPVTPPQEKVE